MTVTSQIAVPPGYHELLEEIASRISTSQVRAALGVSRELVLLYWSIGREILVRQGPKAGEPRSSIGWAATCRPGFPGSKASAQETSSICGRWLRPGPTPQ